MCMFLVTSPRCQEAEKTGSQLLGIVRRPETRPAPKNFPEWNYFRFSSTSPRIETWLRALESVRKILKPLKLDKIKVVAGLVFSALSCAWPEGPIGFVLMLQPLSPTPWQLTSPQPSRSLSNWKALGWLAAARVGYKRSGASPSFLFKLRIPKKGYCWGKTNYFYHPKAKPGKWGLWIPVELNNDFYTGQQIKSDSLYSFWTLL